MRSEIYRKKQPDLEWYFRAAATSPERQAAVREMIATVARDIRAVYEIAEENGTTVWQWPILSLTARKF